MIIDPSSELFKNVDSLTDIGRLLLGFFCILFWGPTGAGIFEDQMAGEQFKQCKVKQIFWFLNADVYIRYLVKCISFMNENVAVYMCACKAGTEW